MDFETTGLQKSISVIRLGDQRTSKTLAMKFIHLSLAVLRKSFRTAPWLQNGYRSRHTHRTRTAYTVLQQHRSTTLICIPDGILYPDPEAANMRLKNLRIYRKIAISVNPGIYFGEK